jgi:hypothetical protein
MNRRQFLAGIILGTVAVAVIDVVVPADEPEADDEPPP